MQRFTRIIGLTAILLLLMGPEIVSATQICSNGTVNPGEEDCLGPISATSSVEIMGSGSGRNLRFRIYWAASGTPTTLLYDQTALSFTAVWNSGTSPTLFPGVFKVCGKRPTTDTNGAQYQLCINPDYL